MITGRLAPHNGEAEQAVLGSILIDQGDEITHKVIELLEVDDFFSERHQAIYKACLECHGAGFAVDQITLSRQLSQNNALEDVGGAAYLSHLIATTPTSFHAGYYARIVKELSAQRKLIILATEIAAKGYECKPIDETVQTAGTELNLIARSQSQDSVYTSRELAQRGMERYNTKAIKESLLPSGLATLDDVIGGYTKGELIIIAARPRIGKTTFMLDCGLKQAKENNILFCSLEMTKDAILDKITSNLSGINSASIRLGELNETDLGYITEAMGELDNLKFHYVDRREGLTVAAIQRAAERTALSFGLDCIYIDYLGLIHGSRNLKEYDRVTQVITDLKDMAVNLNVPVVVACQLSRGIEHRTQKMTDFDSDDAKYPELSDLRSSGEIEQTADIVMFLHRKISYTEINNEVILLLSKMRATGAGFKKILKFNNGRYV